MINKIVQWFIDKFVMQSVEPNINPLTDKLGVSLKDSKDYVFESKHSQKK